MEIGASFFSSKLARRFCLLFILCAFVPTVALIVMSYNQVVDQLEEQSHIRLKREVKAYGLSLYDRMLRIDNDLQSIGRIVLSSQNDYDSLHQQYSTTFEELFQGVAIYSRNRPFRLVFGKLEIDTVEYLLTNETITDKKPFIFTTMVDNEDIRFFFGRNIIRPGSVPFSIIAEVKSEYLWGIGSTPILPPMTELAVYDKSGNNIVASVDGFPGTFRGLKKIHGDDDLSFFKFEINGEVYHAGISNLFVESLFQKTEWIIVISQARRDIMSALDQFKVTFPSIIALLLVLIVYLSMVFIRRGLDPLERLRQGTKRIAQKDFSSLVDIQSGDELEELGHSFNDMAVKLERQFNALNVLGEIDRAILSSLNREKVLATTLQRLKEFFACDLSVYLKISGSSTGHIKVYTMEGRRMGDPVIQYYPLTQGLLEKIFVDQNHCSIDSHDESLFFLKEIAGDSQLEYLCLPLSVDGRIQRALLLGRRVGSFYSEDELTQARKISNQLAIALANSILVDDLEKLAKGAVEALARTVDAKSKWTSGHSERVAELGGKIGQVMGLSESDTETIYRGALLHDIGKISIPASILDKAGKLTDQEYNEIKEHPEAGARILEPIKAYQDIIPVVAQHHEKYDGTGYPKGLSGDEIDIRARVLAVADVWDALVSDRPYRGGWVADKAKDFLLEGAGTYFDPQVINAFLTVMSEESTRK